MTDPAAINVHRIDPSQDITFWLGLAERALAQMAANQASHGQGRPRDERYDAAVARYMAGLQSTHLADSRWPVQRPARAGSQRPPRHAPGFARPSATRTGADAQSPPPNAR